MASTPAPTTTTIIKENEIPRLEFKPLDLGINYATDNNF